MTYSNAAPLRRSSASTGANFSKRTGSRALARPFCRRVAASKADGLNRPETWRRLSDGEGSPYGECLTMADAINEQTLMVTAMYGSTLHEQKGHHWVWRRRGSTAAKASSGSRGSNSPRSGRRPSGIARCCAITALRPLSTRKCRTPPVTAYRVGAGDSRGIRDAAVQWLRRVCSGLYG